MHSTPADRVWRPGRPVPVGSILGVLRKGSGDPTYRIASDGAHWRGIRTPEGTATLRIHGGAERDGVSAQAWGEGRDWVLDRLPRLLGDDDDPSGFVPGHPVLEEAHRHHPHWRIARTDLVMEALTPAIIEQKVTGQEAFAGFRMLVRRFGEPAPGPGAELRLMIQPSAETIRHIPSWEWLRMHIDPGRSKPLVLVARHAANVERCVGRDGGAELLDRRLRSLPGIGEWTSAEVRSRALGDADAVSFFDYHIAKNVGWALTGTEFTDEEMRSYLEPWRPHRYRVQQLIALAGLSRPRHGPRMAPRRHLPT